MRNVKVQVFSDSSTLIMPPLDDNNKKAKAIF